jgi:hypothetical protein
MVWVGFHFECFLGWLFSLCVGGTGGMEVRIDGVVPLHQRFYLRVVPCTRRSNSVFSVID